VARFWTTVYIAQNVCELADEPMTEIAISLQHHSRKDMFHILDTIRPY